MNIHYDANGQKTPKKRVFKMQKGGGVGAAVVATRLVEAGGQAGEKGHGQLRTTLMRPAKRLHGDSRQSLLVARISLLDRRR